MRLKLAGAALVAFALAVAGCGEPTGGTGGGGGSDGGGGSGGGTANPKRGAITLNQSCVNVAGTDYCSSSASAGFASTAVAANPNCTTSTVGGCQVVECVVPADAGVPTTIAPESAGTITIGGTLADGGISLTFTDAGYAAWSSSTKIWAGGESLTAAAAGATVPAFSGKTVAAPNSIVVTAPACTAGNCGTILPTSDLSVTWTGGAATEINAAISSTRSDKTVSVTCKLASSPATIATAALAKLGTNDAGFTNFLSITPSNKTTFTAGSYDVVLTAGGLGGGGSFSTTATPCKTGSCPMGKVCTLATGVCETPKACSTTVQQPDLCSYGQYCAASACTEVTAPSCANFTPPGGKQPVWDGVSTNGPIIYALQALPGDNNTVTGTDFCGANKTFTVLIKAYNANSTFSATGAALAGLHYVTETGNDCDAVNCGGGPIFRLMSGYTVSTDRKHVQIKVSLCPPNQTLTSINAGFYFTGGNEACASVAD